MISINKVYYLEILQFVFTVQRFIILRRGNFHIVNMMFVST